MVQDRRRIGEEMVERERREERTGVMGERYIVEKSRVVIEEEIELQVRVRTATARPLNSIVREGEYEQ